MTSAVANGAGDGSQKASVIGSVDSVVSLGAGSSHSVALTGCGIVVSFGRGEDGQLGQGSSDQLSHPQAILALLGDKSISSVCCGAEYSLAVSESQRTVYSWGWGDFGRLGHGDSTDQFLPKPIAFFSGRPVREVACGDTHTLVITDTGLFTFGRNQNGQLGLGHTDDQQSPQLVAGLQGQQVVSVAGGAEHSIAATASGQVYGWGWGRYGNLGNGTLEDRLTPTMVSGLDGVHVAKVNCGWRHSVAVSQAGQVYTFGWSKYGQLGLGDQQDRPVPTLVPTLKDKVVVAVAGGWRHTMAADSDGVLYAWGWNKFGQLGLGDTEDRCVPTPVSSLAGEAVALLASGWRHTLAVMANGRLYSWGRGVNGQLGHGDEEDRHTPTLLPALSRGTLCSAALAATASHSHGSVALADRYAVVPGATGRGAQGPGDLVPGVPSMLVPTHGPGSSADVQMSAADRGLASGEDAGRHGPGHEQSGPAGVWLGIGDDDPDATVPEVPQLYPAGPGNGEHADDGAQAGQPGNNGSSSKRARLGGDAQAVA